MATELETDLERYAHELYTRHDLNAGVKIVKEVAGMVALGGLALTVMTVWLPAVGLTVSVGTVATVVLRAGVAYAKATAAERKQIRAAVRWIKGGFSLGSRLVG